MGKLTKKSKVPKSRKEIRKSKRQEKKQRKFDHYVNRTKPGKFVLKPNNSQMDEPQVENKSNKRKLDVLDCRVKEIKAEKIEHKKLQKAMAKQRAKQMQAANEDEDRNIKHLEKQLKLNKRKRKSVPKSFSVDGLDYLLEVCDPESMKSIATAEKQFADANSEFDDDFALIAGNSSEKEDNYNSDSSDSSKMNDVNLAASNKKLCDSELVSSDSSEDENEEVKETWEDIYGRMRNKDGEVVEMNTGKYVPPALRNKTASVDQKQAEKIARLRKQIKGLLNRLAESNMHSIANQIENMYMSNSRNDMNETLTELIFEALISPVMTPERLLLEYTLLVTILHANVGTEVGAHFLQTVVHKFDELYNKDQPIENKELDNVVHIIAQLFNFKVVHSQLLYQILGKLSAKFEEKHVESILLVLKNVGFSLRKDDPLALKQLILDLQKKAASGSNNNTRVKFMLDILLAIKNNNMSKIPNYDTTYSEHLKKVGKNFIRKGNYITQLNISLEDLLKAEERGRWWIVGSAWTGNDDKKPEKDSNINTPLFNQKILDLAKKQRMNTDTRRNIFYSLMTAENYTDAFEKILSLNLKGQQEREIIHVLLHCSLQEKQYNLYYSLIAQKLCEYDRKYQMMIRCSIWDKLKTLTACSGKQISILSKLLTYLFLNEGLPISTLKVIQFSELDQITLRLIRQILLGILLHSNEEKCLAVFGKVAVSPKLKIFRESLRLFIHHFLLRNLSNSELSEENKNLLTTRAQLAEKHLLNTKEKNKY